MNNSVKKKTQRGFQVVEFSDYNGAECSLQQSSLAIFNPPGSSAIWLGVNDIDPKIMADDAIKLGIDTKGVTTGWVSYPEKFPEEVLVTTRMHLNLEQVKWLIEELSAWVDTGEFKEEE